MQPKNESTSLRPEDNKPLTQPAASLPGTVVNTQVTFDNRQLHLPAADFLQLTDPERLARYKHIDPAIVPWIMGEVSKNAEHRRSQEAQQLQATIDDRKAVIQYAYFGVSASVLLTLMACGTLMYAATNNAPAAVAAACVAVLPQVVESFRRFVQTESDGLKKSTPSAQPRDTTTSGSSVPSPGTSSHRTAASGQSGSHKKKDRKH